MKTPTPTVDLSALARYENIVLYGGSFDPPHVAHVRLPTLAARAIGADALVYVPTGYQPMKRGLGPTPAHHRLAMLRLALAEVDHALILTDEIDRAAQMKGDTSPAATPHPPLPLPTASYTVDTLERLRDRIGDRVRLRLLLGTDALRDFWKWRRPQRILELAEPLVMLRPPTDRDTVFARLPGSEDRRLWEPRLIDVPQMDVSSSDIRRRVTDGKPISGLVVDTVDRYIKEHGLYHHRDN